MKQIIVSGFGGQGVLSLGLMFSYAALHENKNTSFLPSYGPEMRGGTANCSVVISEREVASPVISRPDMLIAFNEPSLARFLPVVAEGGRIFVDADSANAEIKSRTDVVAVPLAALCGNNHKGQNIVMLGASIAAAGLSSVAAEEAVRSAFKRKPQFVDANLKCLHAGIDWAKKAGVQ
ncbi:MAG: 2-oxoacid:acceptor oxidoreductase family protein [Clostridiales bacterium]|nr:2-oxoacid:acceptor oxidoreductase family protein [Clostridiales bacterium]